MKRKMLFCFFFMTFSICCSHLLAQDIIVKKNGDKIKAVIKEVSDTEIKYTNYSDPNGILFTMDRALIKEVKFAYGAKMKEEAPALDESYYYEDKRSNLKLNFTAIGAGYGILTYEQAIDIASSFEVSLKIPGAGIPRNNEKLSGAGVNVAYKLKLGSLFGKNDEYRPKHLLDGWYFRPNLGYTYSKTKNEDGFDIFNGNYDATVTRSIVNFGLDFGRQYIVSNRVSIDLYAGFHYYGGGIEKVERSGSTIPADEVNGDYIDARGGDLIGGDNIAFVFGLRVGVLFGNQDQKKKGRR